jgi:hypothetical protein
MSETVFEELRESVIEMGRVMKGEIPSSREFTYEIEVPRRLPARGWAICLTHEDDALTPRKLYQVTYAGKGKYVSLTDDEGEVLVCPGERFFAVRLPQEVEPLLAA